MSKPLFSYYGGKQREADRMRFGKLPSRSATRIIYRYKGYMTKLHWFLLSYFNKLAKKIAQEEKEACPEWLDEEFYSILEEIDEKDNTHYSKIYEDSCHEPQVVIRPTPNGLECEIRCLPIDSRIPDICNQKFPKTEKEILEIVRSSYEKFCDKK